jgi:hypothetical protein
MSFDQEVIENLKRSREIVGELEPVFVTPDGEIIDGRHRLKAYPGWRTQTVDVSRKDAILLKLHKNYRRAVSKEETKQLLLELAQALEKEGVPQEQIAQEVVKLSPYSETYTLSLLPRKYKQPKKAEAGERAKKSTYKILYPPEKPTQPEREEKREERQQILQCPICGSLLMLGKDGLLHPRS